MKQEHEHGHRHHSGPHEGRRGFGPHDERGIPHDARHHHDDKEDAPSGRGGRPPRGGQGEGHEGGGPHGWGGHHGGGRHGGGGPRGRARRGEARYVLLDALRDGPKHGYEIIKSLEERSGGEYAPSPGTVYPTMQFLEEMGQVRSDQESERRVYHLTDAGHAELDARVDELAEFWARFVGPPPGAANQAQVGFLREALEDLGRTVWGGVRDVGNGPGGPDTLRRVRQALERHRSEIREIIAEGAAGRDPE